MEHVGRTKFKKLNPRQGYLAPYIQLPWGYREDLIGKEVDIFEVDGGFFIRVTDNPNCEFKRMPDTNIEKRLDALELNFNAVISYISQREGPFIGEFLKQERPGRNSNPSRLRDRQT